MMDLHSAIRQRGRVEGNLLLVDDFLNHRVDPDLMMEIGSSLAKGFSSRPELILTAEASGIAPGLACAHALGVDMIYAKKFVGPGRAGSVGRDVTSPTKGFEYRVEVARRVMPGGTSIGVIDDFLSRGMTAVALCEIAEEAGCTVAGAGFVIEKSFMSGRSLLEERNWRVHSLANVESLVDGEAKLTT